MVEVHGVFIILERIMVYLNRLVRLMKLKILLFLVVAIFRNVRTVGLRKVLNQEIRVIVGHSRSITFGKCYSMV